MLLRREKGSVLLLPRRAAASANSKNALLRLLCKRKGANNSNRSLVARTEALSSSLLLRAPGMMRAQDASPFARKKSPAARRSYQTLGFVTNPFLTTARVEETRLREGGW